MTASSLPFASIENEHLRLDYLTTTGPRIIGLYLHGLEGNLLAETPDVSWETRHGTYSLHGGHRLWTAPEDPFYTSPEEGLYVRPETDGVKLKSPVDASGLEKEITIRLVGNCVHLTHYVTWHGENPVELAPWAITQLRLGGMAILPLSKGEGLGPDRNLVFWPYSDIKDGRFQVQNDLILIQGHAANYAFKIGNHNTDGWIACALGNALFIKRFSIEETGIYPDLGCNVEAYVKDSCLELESLGPLRLLTKGESVTHEETWEIRTAEYPAKSASAQKIAKQLSRTHTEWSNNG